MAEERDFEEIPEQIHELNALMKKLDRLAIDGGEPIEADQIPYADEPAGGDGDRPGEGPGPEGPAGGDEPADMDVPPRPPREPRPSPRYQDEEEGYFPSGDTKPIWEHVAEEEAPRQPAAPVQARVPRKPVAGPRQKTVARPRAARGASAGEQAAALPVVGTAARPAVPTPARRGPGSVPKDLTPEQIGRYVEMVEKVSSLILDEVGKTILGKEYVLKVVMTAILADGHVLFEDYPGLAKTLLANTYAKALGCKFRRSQFTPDLLPSDITGTFIFDEREADFKFREGPVFTNILLSDEINRSPPKTQAALLEAMQERQVTLEGQTMPLPRPFIVLATQNPIEYEGTYSLPEAQLDRFLIRMGIGYPAEDVERNILRARMERRQDETDVKRVASPDTIIKMQKIVELVYVSDPIIEYIVSLVRATRDDPRTMVGSSPRGSLAIFKLSRAWAALNGRDFVIPDDVKEIALHALNHRIILNPEPRIMGVKPEDVIQDIIAEIPVPVVE